MNYYKAYSIVKDRKSIFLKFEIMEQSQSVYNRLHFKREKHTVKMLN